MSLRALNEGVYEGGWTPAEDLASGACWAKKKRAQRPPGGAAAPPSGGGDGSGSSGGDGGQGPAGGGGGIASRLRDTEARKKRKEQPGAEQKRAGRKKGRTAIGQHSKGHSQAVRDAAAAFDVNVVSDELGSGASGTVFLARCVVRKTGSN